jgi:hypothetical protein
MAGRWPDRFSLHKPPHPRIILPCPVLILADLGIEWQPLVPPRLPNAREAPAGVGHVAVVERGEQRFVRGVVVAVEVQVEDAAGGRWATAAAGAAGLDRVLVDVVHVTVSVVVAVAACLMDG